jgi:hypothetical protein
MLELSWFCFVKVGEHFVAFSGCFMSDFDLDEVLGEFSSEGEEHCEQDIDRSHLGARRDLLCVSLPYVFRLWFECGSLAVVHRRWRVWCSNRSACSVVWTLAPDQTERPHVMHETLKSIVQVFCILLCPAHRQVN